MSATGTTGYFTFGVPPERYHLPHPPLGLPVILLIRRVLLRAFEKLAEREFPLATELEDRITEQLFNVIENDLRQSGEIKGFTTRAYDRVVRHAQVTDYAGVRLAKTPDLSFKLRNDETEPRLALSSHEALFVECKPVDNDHSAGSDYCDKGLLRFVNGDYAWAMERALMIGYVRHGRTIAKHLIPTMEETKRRTSLRVVELPRALELPSACSTDTCEALHVSEHERGFPWPDGKGAATDIVVYHSWHRCE
jgi:hypothetical protein